MRMRQACSAMREFITRNLIVPIKYLIIHSSMVLGPLEFSSADQGRLLHPHDHGDSGARAKEFGHLKIEMCASRRRCR
jgi:hypothetical protein